MAVGLKHLHAHRVLHRDIKTQNVFLDANGNLKIGDLGLARIMGSQSLYAYTGTSLSLILYLSPFFLLSFRIMGSQSLYTGIIVVFFLLLF